MRHSLSLAELIFIRPMRLSVAVMIFALVEIGVFTASPQDFAAAAAESDEKAKTQDRALIPDSSIPIPALQFDSSGALVIQPSSTSSQHDFDFLVGTWKLRNRKLASRLTHSTEWKSFESRVEMHQILNGFGNIDKYTDQASGKPYEGVAIRLFNPTTRLWSIYWADNNSGSLDPPVVGSFENKIGHFFARDTFKDRPIIVVFRWDVRDPSLPVWSQAFSTDEGKTWEWNSINVSERVH